MKVIKELTKEQKRLNIDLLIIIIFTFAVLGTYIAVQNQFSAIMADGNIHVLLRVLFAAVFQFGLAGLGITVVSVIRKESFLSYGLRVKGSVLSILFSALCFVPSFIFTVATGSFEGYLPFQSVYTTKEALAGGFPINAAGMLLTAAVWGFFEGFNYVVISDKINKRFPAKSRWLNWGAIICAVMCILVHGAIGVTPKDIVEMLTIMFLIYGMMIVKEFTKNAWGCVFVFVFLWNAF